ncbi:MAG: CHASE2 domain-containing protein [Candidatus Omnitrophica bacterium]|nr:CHASE2 domain-containing protein [Candidatus Omnitrophota bacterium]
MPSKKSFYISSNAIKIIAIIFICVLAAAVSYLKIFETFELATLDLRFKTRPHQKTSDKIIIIEIAQDTLEQLGSWPIDREFHARLVDVLTKYGASSVVFDIVFTQSQSELSDQDLLDAVKASRKVYLAEAFRLNKTRKPGCVFPQADGLEIFPFEGLDKAARGMGHINIVPDIDGKRRRVPVFIDYNNELQPQLSFLTACDYLNIPLNKIKTDKGLVVMSPDIKIPIDERGNIIINFSDLWVKSFKHYSFIDILSSYLQIESGEKPILDLEIFKDKICIIGLTATGTHDLNPVPMEANYPMVGVHANFINSILTNNFIQRADRPVNALLIILLGIITSFLTLKLKPLKGLIAAVSFLLAFGLLVFFIFVFFNIWMDLFYPLIFISLVYISSTFYKYISERNRRMLMEKELDIAYTIQKSFLKEMPPAKEGMEIAGVMNPARTIGGDLYDFVEISENKTGIMIGDVSGKGVPAALFMAKTVSEFRFHSRTQNTPEAAISRLNDQISIESTSGLFVTLCYMIIDTKQKLIDIVNAGHLPVIKVNKNKLSNALKVESATAIGIMDGIDFVRNTIPYEPGDIYLLYTDGVTEAWNRKKEEFGEERLKVVLAASSHKKPEKIIEDILKDMRKFQGKAPQHDDITLIVIKL